ncbi:hypothetical protein ACFQZT_06780 [Paenibacillus sp. GCM10027628]
MSILLENDESLKGGVRERGKQKAAFIQSDKNSLLIIDLYELRLYCAAIKTTKALPLFHPCGSMTAPVRIAKQTLAAETLNAASGLP